MISDIDKVVPKDSFIAQYMQHMKSVESSKLHDFWCGIFMIGVAVGEHAYVDRPRAVVHLNWNLILTDSIGPATKPTSIHAVKAILGSTFDMISDGISFAIKDSIVDIIGKKSSDKPAIDHIVNSSVLYSAGMISTTTPDWVFHNMDVDGDEGVLLSKTLFIMNTMRTRPIAWPEMGNDLTKDLAERLMVFREFTTRTKNLPISITKAAISNLTLWYSNRPIHSDAYRACIELREDEFVLRLAACLCINDGLWEIQSRHIKYSIRLINDCKQNGYQLFRREPFKDEHIIRGIERCRLVLSQRGGGGIRHVHLFRACSNFLTIQEFKTLISIMHETGMVTILDSPKKHGGKMYRSTVNTLDQVRFDNALLNLLPET